MNSRPGGISPEHPLRKPASLGGLSADWSEKQGACRPPFLRPNEALLSTAYTLHTCSHNKHGLTVVPGLFQSRKIRMNKTSDNFRKCQPPKARESGTTGWPSPAAVTCQRMSSNPTLHTSLYLPLPPKPLSLQQELQFSNQCGTPKELIRARLARYGLHSLPCPLTALFRAGTDIHIPLFLTEKQ